MAGATASALLSQWPSAGPCLTTFVPPPSHAHKQLLFTVVAAGLAPASSSSHLRILCRRCRSHNLGRVPGAS